MDKRIGKDQVSQDDSFESSDIEQAWRALARIIARRHIKNQLNKIKGNIDENIINHDGNNNSSNN
jgi:hypothetical protein